MTRRKPSPRPEYALSPEALRQQLIRSNDKIALLEGRNTALRSQLGRDPDPLLVEIAQAIQLAKEVSNPQQAHILDPVQITTSVNVPPIPGASTANPRRAAKHFFGQLEKALQGFEGARQRNWQPRERVPSVRCVNRECSKRNKRLPAWDHRGPNEFCGGPGGCGHRMHLADPAKDGEAYRSPSHVQE